MLILFRFACIKINWEQIIFLVSLSVCIQILLICGSLSASKINKTVVTVNANVCVLFNTRPFFLPEGTIIVKEPGESVTLKCSTEGSPLSNDGYAGMYLYHNSTEQNEVYFNNKIVDFDLQESQLLITLNLSLTTQSVMISFGMG